MDKATLKNLERMVWSFIWSGKRDRISRNTMSLPKNKGGMGAFSVPDYCAALRLKIW